MPKFTIKGSCLAIMHTVITVEAASLEEAKEEGRKELQDHQDWKQVELQSHDAEVIDVRPTLPTPALLKCPKCGWDEEREEPPANGSGFVYLEEVVAHRYVLRLDGNTLIISGKEEFPSEDTYSANRRILCPNCLDEFDIPEMLTIDFE